MLKRSWSAVLVSLILIGCSSELSYEPQWEPRADGTAGVAWFDTPLWGVVELDYVWQDGQMVHGGDVVLEPDLMISADEAEGLRTTRQGLVRRAFITPWAMKNGVVTIPYKWDNMSDAKKTKVRKAMDNWEAELPFLKFVHDPNPTGRWVRIVGKNQAYCYVRMRSSGETVLEAGNPCSWHTHVHELGHVLSLRHEQLRKDRGAHVNFYKARTTSPSQFCWDDGTNCIGKDYLGTSYDTSSVMQYPSCMLAKQSNCNASTPAKWVMEKKSGTGYIPWWEKRSFGQVLSASDKCGVKTMFGLACNNSTPPPTCVPDTCASLGKTCGGGYSDGCGGTLSCGTCGGTDVCNSGTCVAVDPYPVASWVTGTLQNDSTGTTLCAEVANGATAEGTTVTTASCTSTDTEQNWTLTRSGQLKNYNTKRCAAPSAEAAGATVAQQLCSRDALQQWKLGNMEIVNGRSGRCVDVPGADYVAGKTLVYWECHGGDNQKFTYDYETRELRIQGWCVAGSATADAEVKLQSCDGSEAQGWDAARGGFSNRANPNLCLAVEGGGAAASGASIAMKACNDAVGQMWALRGPIEHSNDTYCLEAGPLGADLTIGDCDPTSAAQRFTFWSNFGCTPTTCSDLAANCDTIPDDCGGTVDCGACGAGEQCSGANQCEVICDETDGDFCRRMGSACGLTVGQDACGNERTVECGSCDEISLCAENACVLPAAGSLFSRVIEPTGVCAEVAGGVTDDGAALVPWLCHGADNQQWTVDFDSRLRAMHSGKCAAAGEAGEAGLGLQQANCEVGDGVLTWSLASLELVNAGGGLCLTAAGSERSPTVEPCGAANQTFEYRASSHEIVVDDLCLSAEPSSRARFWACSGTADQRWLPARGGFVLATATDHCLAIEGGEPGAPGATLAAVPCTDEPEQRWALRGEVRDASSDLCLSTPAEEGDQIYLADCDGGAGQRWTFWSQPQPVACVPTTCEELGVPCGPVDDGCGVTLDCGPCGDDDGDPIPPACEDVDCNPDEEPPSEEDGSDAVEARGQSCACATNATPVDLLPLLVLVAAGLIRRRHAPRR